MSTLTIHALDAVVEKRVRAKAKRDGRSLNQTLKELLAMSVGARPSPAADHRADFAEFCGIWTPQDAREFKAATADLETVDKADWQ
jgi:plasmid stability protein